MKFNLVLFSILLASCGSYSYENFSVDFQVVNNSNSSLTIQARSENGPARQYSIPSGETRRYLQAGIDEDYIGLEGDDDDYFFSVSFDLDENSLGAFRYNRRNVVYTKGNHINLIFRCTDDTCSTE